MGMDFIDRCTLSEQARLKASELASNLPDDVYVEKRKVNRRQWEGELLMLGFPYQSHPVIVAERGPGESGYTLITYSPVEDEDRCWLTIRIDCDQVLTLPGRVAGCRLGAREGDDEIDPPAFYTQFFSTKAKQHELD